MAELVEFRDVNPEVKGSNPALVNFSLFTPNNVLEIVQQFP